MALLRTNSRAEKCMVIGDDINTDVVGGRSLGALTIQVKTGIYNASEVCRDNMEPDFLLDSVNDIINLLDKNTAID